MLALLMKISTILDHIDSGLMALPEFQRGYVWNRGQIRAFFDSLYRGHPVGSLLVWVTESQSADYRGDVELGPGMVNLLLDGQQRITTIYSVARGRPPVFFDREPSIFRGLHFHLEDEQFSFYQPVKMRDDPLWLDVTTVLKNEHVEYLISLNLAPEELGRHLGRANRVHQILDIDLHTEPITGPDKSLFTWLRYSTR